MTPRTRQGIAMGLVGALGFTAGLFAGVTRERPVTPSANEINDRILERAIGIARAIQKDRDECWRGRAELSDLLLRQRTLPPRRPSLKGDALERAYRANLAREGLTPRVSHEAR